MMPGAKLSLFLQVAWQVVAPALLPAPHARLENVAAAITAMPAKLCYKTRQPGQLLLLLS
jgi:hypothetical protein